MRNEFEKWAGHAVEFNMPSWISWQSCAESYEKKLAEKDAEYQAQRRAALDNKDWFDVLKVDYDEKCKQLSESNARNAMLLEKAISLIEGVRNARVAFLSENSDGETDCVTPYDEYLYDLKAITANSESVAAWEAGKLEPNPQLCKFYDVSTYPDLVAAMEHHITKLQEKITTSTDFRPKRPREG